MATAFPQSTEHGDDNFVLELNREKDKGGTTVELRLSELQLTNAITFLTHPLLIFVPLVDPL